MIKHNLFLPLIAITQVITAADTTEVLMRYFIRVVDPIKIKMHLTQKKTNENNGK